MLKIGDTVTVKKIEIPGFRWGDQHDFCLDKTLIVRTITYDDKFHFAKYGLTTNGSDLIHFEERHLVTTGEKGKKFDGDKLRFDLIPPECEAMIAAVFTMGAMKYSPDNWQHVEGFDWRYYNGKIRHSNQKRLGEVFDSDSGLPHSAHVAVNAIFELWKDIHILIDKEDVLKFINEALSQFKEKLEKKEEKNG